MSTRSRFALMLVAALAAPLAPAAFAAPVPRMIVNVDITSPLSLVPGGLLDERFTGDFNEMYRSPNGTYWITTGRTTLGRIVLLSGSGTTVNTEVIGDPFTPAPWNELEGLNVAAGFGEMYAINDSGDIAFAATEAFSGKRVMVKRVAGVFTVLAREGEVCPLVSGGTENWGGFFEPFNISSSGQVSYRASNTVGALPDTQDDFVVIGSQVFQVGVTPILGRTFDNFGQTTYIAADQDGVNWIAVTNLSGAATDDDVTLVNGAVVIREGTPFGGLTPNQRLAGASISGNGAWWTSRGQGNVGTLDFIARNAAIVAKKGDPIFTGSPTLWTAGAGYNRTFLSSAIDNAGNYSIIGGFGNGTTLSSAGFVYNGTTTVIQHGNGVDVDGDNLADNIFVNILAGTGTDLNTQVLASDALYAVINTTDDLSATRGEAIIRIALGGACNRADVTEVGGTLESPGSPDGQLTVDDLVVWVNAFSDGTGCPGTAPCNLADVTAVGGPPAGPDGELTVDDLIAFVNAFIEGC